MDVVREDMEAVGVMGDNVLNRGKWMGMIRLW